MVKLHVASVKLEPFKINQAKQSVRHVLLAAFNNKGDKIIVILSVLLETFVLRELKIPQLALLEAYVLRELQVPHPALLEAFVLHQRAPKSALLEAFVLREFKVPDPALLEAL